MHMSNKAGVKKNSQSTILPRLRFPEYSDAPGWELKQLGELFSERVESGRPGLPLLSLMDKEGVVPQESTNRKNNSNSDKSKYLRVVPGDIVYNTMRMWEGRSAFVGIEGLVSPAYTVCEPLVDADSLFFSYYFKTPQLIEQFRRFSQGLVKDTLNLKYAAFSKIWAPAPAMPEQQKIAECLRSMDQVIDVQTQKLDALRSHKKGLMQLLFPRAGESLPRLRFPEFQNAPDWESGQLGSIFETSSGGTPSRSKKSYWGGTIPWVTTSLVNFCVINVAEEFISEEGLRNSSAKIFPEGTVLIAMYGQGKTRGQAALLGIDAATNQACAAILPKKGIEPYFVFLNCAARYDEMRELSNSGGQENLSQGLIREIRFSYPSDLAEQNAITSCLVSLDDLINAQSAKLAAVKTYKKGLVQQLFPSLNEVDA
jgi:type I restriction enzyme S subunit